MIGGVNSGSVATYDTRAKLVFMIEGRPSGDGARLLRPGQPVTVTRQ